MSIAQDPLFDMRTKEDMRANYLDGRQSRPRPAALSTRGGSSNDAAIRAAGSQLGGTSGGGGCWCHALRADSIRAHVTDPVMQANLLARLIGPNTST